MTTDFVNHEGQRVLHVADKVNGSTLSLNKTTTVPVPYDATKVNDLFLTENLSSSQQVTLTFVSNTLKIVPLYNEDGDLYAYTMGRRIAITGGMTLTIRVCLLLWTSCCVLRCPITPLVLICRNAPRRISRTVLIMV